MKEREGETFNGEDAVHEHNLFAGFSRENDAVGTSGKCQYHRVACDKRVKLGVVGWGRVGG